jgi:glycosyltransferase involved in cell wall biosynthesis
MNKGCGMKYKVIYVCDDLMLGGWTSIVATILELKKEGYLISVVTLFGKGYNAEILEKNGINVRCLNLNKFNLPFKLLQLVHVFRTEKPDIVHTNLHYSDTFGILCAFLARVKIRIIQIHSIKEKYRHKLRLLKKFSMSKVSIAIAVSQAASKDFKEEIPSFNKEIKIIPNGINICEFRNRVQKSTMSKNDFGISKNTFTILTVANFKWQKGYEYLVSTVDILRTHECRFIIVGYGPEEKNIKNMVAQLGLNEKIIFLGPRIDVPELMKIADVFLLPSIVEPFGICVIEAFFAGLPVIATAVDGIAENVKNMEEAILVNPANPTEIADAIMMLKNNPAMAKKLSEMAMKKSENFEIKNICKKIQDIYEDKKN